MLLVGILLAQIVYDHSWSTKRYRCHNDVPSDPRRRQMCTSARDCRRTSKYPRLAVASGCCKLHAVARYRGTLCTTPGYEFYSPENASLRPGCHVNGKPRDTWERGEKRAPAMLVAEDVSRNRGPHVRTRQNAAVNTGKPRKNIRAGSRICGTVALGVLCGVPLSAQDWTHGKNCLLYTVGNGRAWVCSQQ